MRICERTDPAVEGAGDADGGVAGFGVRLREEAQLERLVAHLAAGDRRDPLLRRRAGRGRRRRRAVPRARAATRSAATAAMPKTMRRSQPVRGAGMPNANAAGNDPRRRLADESSPIRASVTAGAYHCHRLRLPPGGGFLANGLPTLTRSWTPSGNREADRRSIRGSGRACSGEKFGNGREPSSRHSRTLASASSAFPSSGPWSVRNRPASRS